jgi:hypothetical protein
VAHIAAAPSPARWHRAARVRACCDSDYASTAARELRRTATGQTGRGQAKKENVMRDFHPTGKGITFAALLALAGAAAPGHADTAITTAKAAEVTVRNVQAMGTQVQGEVVNNTGDNVVGAELVVRHQWLWANEQKPGTDDPGWIDIYPLAVTIPPGGTAPFSVEATQLPTQRTDGSFATSAFVRSYATQPVQ